MRYAQELLLSTDQNAAAVALAAGFGGASWFSERFKASVGVSPSDFRKRGK